MLNSMKNSYIGLFKVIDIAMSNTLKFDKKRIIYFYNRIITFDDILFGTGIHCMMVSKHKSLKEFIKNHKYKEYSDFSRCILL